MIVFRKLFRSARVVLLFAFGMAELAIRRPRTRQQRAAWLTAFCRRLLRAAHIDCRTEGPVPQGGAVISNHLSYTDILLHASMRPCVFVSKAELRKTPVLGWISMMAGTVYVERGAGGSAEKAAQGMAKGFRDGLPIVFFPEGTTGVGDEVVMPFRSGLLSQAMAAGQPVTPGFIHYELSEEDRRRGQTTRDAVHWGPQTLPAHLWNLVGLEAIHARVRFAGQPIAFSEAALSDRKVAAEEARQAVAALAEAAPESNVDLPETYQRT